MPRSSKVEWGDFFARVDEAALARPELIAELLPGGHREGKEWRCGDLNGTPGASFGFNLETGVWVDFASADKGGRGVIALRARRQGQRMGDAALELARILGINPPKLKVARDAWTPIVPIPPDVELKLPHGCPALQHGALKPGATAWVYLGVRGEALMARVRVDFQDGGKEVLPLTWCQNEAGERAWRWRDMAAPRPLYNLERLAGAAPETPILVVSGEKCAEAATAALPDWVVMTWPGGDNRASKKDTDWRPLQAHKGRVYLWPDNDTSGKDAILVIAETLREQEPLIIKPDPSWPEKWDIADLIEGGWTSERIIEFIKSASAAPDGPPSAGFRVPVDLSITDLHLQSEAIWEAVKRVNQPPTLFEGTTGLSVVNRDAFDRGQSRAANEALLRHWLVSHLAFTKTIAGGFSIPTHPGDPLMSNLVVGKHPVPGLRRLTEVPIFAPDGRLISTEGYDAASGVYYLPAPELRDLQLIENPSFDDAQDALAILNDLLCDFPFLADVDRTHAIAFAMLPLVRLMIAGRTPLFRFEAPMPRTGKTLLMRQLASIAGTRISDTSPLDDEAEWRKKITSVLASDPDYFLIDNAVNLEFEQLKNLLTGDYWEDRPLHASFTVRFLVRQIFAVSLNNPVLSHEMIGRSLRVRLDARCEQPGLRKGFRHRDIEGYAGQHRARLVTALITLAQYGLDAGGSGAELPTLGGYGPFAQRMGSIMQAIGLTGFLGDREDVSMWSSESALLAEIVERWANSYGENLVTSIQLIQIAEDSGFDFRSKTESGKGKTLTRWMGKFRDNVVGDFAIVHAGRTMRGTEWKLKRL